MRYPILQQSLRDIREISPSACHTIIDIGVQRKTDFLIDVFPDCFHHLFEPVSEYYDELRQNYDSKRIDYKLHQVALSNKNGTKFLHKTSVDGSGRITHSHIRDHPDQSVEFLVEITEVPALTLDWVIAPEQLTPFSYVIKLDVDGAEEDIYSGGENVLKHASFIIIEASLGKRNVISRAELTESLGFRLFDICDNAYYFKQLALVDMVFINNVVRSGELRFRPWELSQGKVLWNEWQHGFCNLLDESADS